VPEDAARASIHLSLGRPTTPDDVETAAAWVVEAVARERGA
jgi:cysteine sulfinate desulfinase/cysteine desulfurase-like protein